MKALLETLSSVFFPYRRLIIYKLFVNVVCTPLAEPSMLEYAWITSYEAMHSCSAVYDSRANSKEILQFLFTMIKALNNA